MRAKKKPGRNRAPVIEIRSDRVYQTNLRTLAQTYPEVYQAVITAGTESPYEVRPSGKGVPNLWLKSRGRYYYEASDPSGDAARQVQGLQLRNTRMAVFLGVGLGYELNYFLREIAGVQRTEHILIIEKDPLMFRELLKLADITKLLQEERFHFLVGVAPEQMYVRLRAFLNERQRFQYLKAMNPVYHPSSLALAKDYYLKALKILREAAVHEIINYGNSPHDSLVGVANMLANVVEIAKNPGINLLYGRFRNKPGIVVATGPSLNKNKHLLKGLEDRALIVAADASLRVLIDMGVKPHLVTSLERVLPTVKLLEGFTKEQVEDVYLAACPVVRPEMYEVYPGPRVIVYRDFDHFRWVGIERGILRIQQSAGNMAFKVAEALGCDPIILIGQDLAYARDGRTHASGTVYGERQAVAARRDDLLEVMGNDGQPILTNQTWYSFLKGYEVDLAGYKGLCINSTEGGAYIQGTVVMPFAQAIERYVQEQFGPLDIIKQALESFTDSQAQEDMEKLSELFDSTLADLDSIMNKCTTGSELIAACASELSSILKGERDNDPGETSRRISALEKEILAHKNACVTKYNRTFQLFLMHIIQSYAIKFEMEMLAVPENYSEEWKARAAILLSHDQWFKTVGEISNICIGLLREAKGKLSDYRERLERAQ
ncbi:MAG TPA: motility associated factor glycosyltransferase family protein [Syntrophothermus lipocalidus]|nr:motility associated factor glycosyltransferase family protein [Syntrophothermus lipocalidus]HOV43182.1 DUF115 domain-containing protein [Syntrophothermus lipocalidus]